MNTNDPRNPHHEHDPDRQPAPPAASADCGPIRVEARRPMSESNRPAPVGADEAMKILADVLGATRIGAFACSKAIDTRTGLTHFIGVLIHPEDLDGAMITGHARTVPVVTFILDADRKFFKPVAP